MIEAVYLLIGLSILISLVLARLQLQFRWWFNSVIKSGNILVVRP